MMWLLWLVSVSLVGPLLEGAGERVQVPRSFTGRDDGASRLQAQVRQALGKRLLSSRCFV